MPEAATRKLIRPAALADRWSVSQPTLYRWVRRGLIPPPTRLGPGTSGWFTDTVEAIERSREEASAS